jgi:hypothetical protein
MLLAAASLDPSEKSIAPLMRDIARGFSMIGDRAADERSMKNISLMYHDNNHASASKKIRAQADDRIQMEYHGKEILIREEISCGENNRKKIKNEFTERIKKFFSRQK